MSAAQLRSLTLTSHEPSPCCAAQPSVHDLTPCAARSLTITITRWKPDIEGAAGLFEQAGEEKRSRNYPCTVLLPVLATSACTQLMRAFRKRLQQATLTRAKGRRTGPSCALRS